MLLVMLDATGKKLLRSLQADQPVELRSAAALLLGELGTRDSEIEATLLGALDDPEPAVRSHVLSALGKLRVDAALPQLLTKVSAGGPEAELAAQAAARLGAKGTHALQAMMPQVAPGLRRRIAAALAAAGTTSAGTAALEALLDKDPGVVDAAARSLIAESSSLSTGSRKALVERVTTLLSAKKGPPLGTAAETALLRILAAIGDSRAEKIFWDRVASTNSSPELRATALQALGTQAVSHDREKLKCLLACAVDPDFRVAAPALMMLKAAEVTSRTLKDWLELFDAPDQAARRLALEKLGDQDTPAVAAALLRQLSRPERDLQKDALACLTRLDHGRTALAEALRTAATVDEVWSMARAQAPFVREYSADLLRSLFQQACAYLEGSDRRADALLFLLRESDPRALRDQMEERALAFRKKKAYEKALIYLRFLARDPACAETIRFELAACGLKLSDHNTTTEARAADPCVQQFARLAHGAEVDLLSRLKQAKWLDPEDLFYLGFHFIEGEKQEREFGAGVLRLVLERSPRSKLAKDARSKLRSVGMGL